MLILKKRPVIRTTLSFSKVTGERLGIQYAGVNMGRPVKATREQFDRVVAEFGLFGGSADPNKFFPDLSMDDIIPKPEDFINIPMRFLSATIVGGGSWKATDFSQEGVLKAATDKLNGKPLFTEHDQDVLNNVGMAVDPYWEEQTGTGDNFVPGGISGTAMVDAKTNPKLARSLLMGAIYSSSVTTTFDWEPSHSFKEMDEFYQAVGMMGKDNKMVRRIVSEVYDIDESSFVWLGADPFAKTKDQQGRLRNIDRKAVYFSKVRENDSLSFDKAPAEEVEKYKTEKKLSVGLGITETLLSLSKEKLSKVTLPGVPKQENNTQAMNKFLLAFVTTFSKELNLSFKVDDTTTELTAEQEQELTDSLAKLGVKVEGAPEAVNFVKSLKVVAENNSFEAADISKLSLNKKEMVVLTKEEYDTVTANAAKVLPDEQMTSLNKRAEQGDKYLQFKRDECVRLYKKSTKEPDAAVLELISKSDMEVVDGLIKTYGGKAVEQYSATCTKCNSGEYISMRSSFETALPDDADAKKETGFSVNSFRQRANDNQGFIVGR